MTGDARSPCQFADGSALLPPSANAPLKQLAAKRGAATIAVVGYGEASAATPDAQSTALTLGLARAQAMAAALTAAGVPAGVGADRRAGHRPRRQRPPGAVNLLRQVATDELPRKTAAMPIARVR